VILPHKPRAAAATPNLPTFAAARAFRSAFSPLPVMRRSRKRRWILRWAHIDGWSEAVVEYIRELERSAD